MLTFIALSMLLQTGLSTQGSDPDLILRQHIVEYDVDAGSYNRFYTRMIEEGPVGQFATFDYELNYDAYFDTVDDECVLHSPKVIIDYTYTLPNWGYFDRANPREQAAYRELYDSQYSILEGYTEILHNESSALIEAMRNAPSFPCEGVQIAFIRYIRPFQRELEQSLRKHQASAPILDARHDTWCEEFGTRIRRCHQDRVARRYGVQRY